MAERTVKQFCGLDSAMKSTSVGCRLNFWFIWKISTIWKSGVCFHEHVWERGEFTQDWKKSNLISGSHISWDNGSIFVNQCHLEACTNPLQTADFLRNFHATGIPCNSSDFKVSAQIPSKLSSNVHLVKYAAHKFVSYPCLHEDQIFLYLVSFEGKICLEEN